MQLVLQIMVAHRGAAAGVTHRVEREQGLANGVKVRIAARNEARREKARQPHLGDRRHPAGLDLRDALDLAGCLDASGGVAQEQVAQPLAGMDAQPLADHAAQRNAAVIEALEPGGIGHRQHVAGEQLDAVVPGRRIRGAMAAGVHPDDAKEIGQPRHHRIPQGMVGAERVHQHQGRQGRVAVCAPEETGAGMCDEGHGVFLKPDYLRRWRWVQEGR